MHAESHQYNKVKQRYLRCSNLFNFDVKQVFAYRDVCN